MLLLPTQAPLARPASLTELFVAFTVLALQGFGGVLAIAQRVLCEQRRWLTREDFVEILAVAQVLPGPNVVNMSLMIGDRFFGSRGAAFALAGMMSVPTVLVLALSAVYMHFADVPAVAGALKGMGAVAAGMIVGTAMRLAPVLRDSPLGRPACYAICAAAFVSIALLRWPLLWVLPVLGVLACGFAWTRLRPKTS
jgi:chromate transporter